MKILFILPEYYPHSGGGISTYYQHYIEALLPHCEKIKVIVGSGFVQANNNFNYNGVTVEYLKPEIYNEYISKFTTYDLCPEFKHNLAAAWAMWQQANKGEGFDIIECTDFGLGFVPWVIHHNQPVITRLHGSSGQISIHENIKNLQAGLYSTTEINLLPLCDGLITHSKANQHFWGQVFPLKQVDQLYPVYTTAHKFLTYKERENFGLITARIQKWKGPAQLCEALAQSHNQSPIKWFGRDMVYDEHPSASEYLKTTYPDVWNKKVIVQQPLPNNEIVVLQQKAKFGIVPSTWDMFNFTVLEFLALGTPVICSDGAGAAELIIHKKNGFKYPATDSAQLAKCIEAVNDLDEQAYNQIINAGIKTIQTKLSPQVLIPVYLDYYRSIIKKFDPVLPGSNIFFNNIYSPNGIQSSMHDILDKQPLKKLSKYMAGRVFKKIIVSLLPSKKIGIK